MNRCIEPPEAVENTQARFRPLGAARLWNRTSPTRRAITSASRSRAAVPASPPVDSFLCELLAAAGPPLHDMSAEKARRIYPEKPARSCLGRLASLRSVPLPAESLLHTLIINKRFGVHCAANYHRYSTRWRRG
jgi:hypothetical protein